ncbi:MAG: RsmD family RNA methyltransferase [Bacteroidales bacterium]|nr:RsmD family RNA methyltransferase [Bacteroidales bacterium]
MITEQEKDLISKYKDCDVNDLALKLKDTESIRSKFVLQQIRGKQLMKKKMPLWAENSDIFFPVHLPLEQCSSSFTANYKHEIAEKLLTDFSLFTDLTGGFGVDFFVISEKFKKAVYNEKNSELCEIVKHNFKVLQRDNADFLSSDGVFFIKNTDKHFNLIFIDPARRNADGKKTVRIEDCEPDILEFQDVMIHKSDFVMIKLSPMIDIFECIKKLHNVKEIHIVATANECKEILIILEKDFSKEPKIFTINDNQRFEFFLSEERNCLSTFFDGEILENNFLFEPNAAVMKSGAFKVLTRNFPVKKLHPSSHLYVSDFDVPEFPGRRFRIVKTGSVKDFKEIKTANLAVRNFPEKAEVLKKKLKIKDGGAIFLFATTLKSGEKIIIQGENIKTPYL